MLLMLPWTCIPAGLGTSHDTTQRHPSSCATNCFTPVLSPCRAPTLIFRSMSSHMSTRSPQYCVVMKPSTSLMWFRYMVPVSPLLRLIQFLESVPSPRWKTWIWGKEDAQHP